MSTVAAIVVATICLAVVATLCFFAFAVLAFFAYKSLVCVQEGPQQSGTHLHASSVHGTRQPSRAQTNVQDLTSPIRPQKSQEKDDGSNRRGRPASSTPVSPQTPYGYDQNSRSNRPDGSAIDGSQFGRSSTPRRMPATRAYSPGHVPVEMVDPEAHLEDMKKGYAAFLACKFNGDVAAHFANVTAVAASYNLDMDDICYCYLCLEAVTNAEGVDGLAIKPHGLNSYSARIWITSLSRFVKFAQGHVWAEDDDRVRSVIEEWQYQADHFLQMIKSCEAPFKRKHGIDLIQAFRQEDIRLKEVARAQQSMIMLGRLSGPCGVNSQAAGSRFVGAAAGMNADAKALDAPPRPAALANVPFSGGLQSDFAGNTSALALRMKKRPLGDLQEGVQKRSRPALPLAASSKSKGGRGRQ